MIWVDVRDGKLMLNTETHRVEVPQHRAGPSDHRPDPGRVDPYRYAEVRGHVSDTTTGASARTQIDELAEKYTDGPYPPDNIKSERVILWAEPERQTFIDQKRGIAD